MEHRVGDRQIAGQRHRCVSIFGGQPRPEHQLELIAADTLDLLLVGFDRARTPRCCGGLHATGELLEIGR